jgi:D-galactarolactone cycloisomerase
MKITELKAYALEQSLGDLSFGFAQGWISARQTTIVTVSTDEGIQGAGECYGPARSIAALINTFFAPRVVGRDPFDTGPIWDESYRYQSMTHVMGIFLEALSGVDIALWDIKGKALGVPIYKLLGGMYRSKAKAYATGLYRPSKGDVKRALVEEAEGYKRDNFSAMKLKVGTVSPEEDLEMIKAIREAVGYEIKLMVDANCAYDATEAILMAKKMEEYDIYWFEEPVPPEDIDGSIEVRKSTNIRLVAGESVHTHYWLRELIRRRAVDILNPDVCMTGGFTEMQRIIAVATAWNTQFITHVWGTNVAIAAGLHCYAATPDIPGKMNPPEPFFEYDCSPNPIRKGTTQEQFEAKDGYIDIPNAPGLGVTVDMDFVKSKAV